MSAWAVAALGLLVALLFAAIAAARGPVAGRLVAIQLAASIATLLAVALCFVDDQASSIDLALTLAMVGLPATLVFVLFHERWL